MTNDAVIDALNTLIVINNDRIEGYDTAAQETDEADLKDLFHKCMNTSATCKAKLVAEVHLLGGTPDEGTRITGKFFRVWMDVKAFLTSKDRVAILDSCEFGENVAIDAYKAVLTDKTEVLSLGHIALLNAQQTLLTNDRDRIVALREALAVAA
jgi:uncharacterized protein (TIGR02284 family)